MRLPGLIEISSSSGSRFRAHGDTARALKARIHVERGWRRGDDDSSDSCPARARGGLRPASARPPGDRRRCQLAAGGRKKHSGDDASSARTTRGASVHAAGSRRVTC